MKPAVKYHIIYRHRTEYPVSVMCAFFGVSRSGYYTFVHRLGRPEKDAALAELIAQQRERSFGTYGYRRMWLWLKTQNIFHNPKQRCFSSPDAVRMHLRSSGSIGCSGVTSVTFGPKLQSSPMVTGASSCTVKLKLAKKFLPMVV